MAVTVTNMTLVRDTVKVEARDAATSTVINEVEVFTITPTKGADKMIIMVEVASTHGAVACSLGAGTQYWASKAKAWSSVVDKTSIFHVSDIARFKTTAGTILLTLTPASGKRLATDHAAKVGVIELP